VHPDKTVASGEEETDEAFMLLKKAYDVLYDTQLRDLYNKFGEPGVENKDDTNALLAGLGFFYVVWLAVAYLLTRKKAVTRAQTWGFTGLLALAIFEYQAKSHVYTRSSHVHTRVFPPRVRHTCPHLSISRV
tara:strand:+ start:3065 stop:3460 length:396 start_codon:yes stop_codon:yes gene_type:complete